MSTAFDNIATLYDESFTHSLIGKAQRDKVWTYLDNHILNTKQKLNILELNCGTGHDAIHFANAGHAVLASDASEKMIEVAKNKQFSQGSIDFRVADFENIGQQLAGEKFDLVFSNFGGINCLDENAVKKLLKELSPHLNPGGRIVLVIMSKKCLWEKLYFLLKGKSNVMVRRENDGPLEVNVNGSTVNTWYYSPDDIRNLAKHYSAEKIISVGFFIPPSYLESFAKKHPVFFSILRWKEKVFARTAFLANYADHFLISLKAT